MCGNPSDWTPNVRDVILARIDQHLGLYLITYPGTVGPRIFLSLDTFVDQWDIGRPLGVRVNWAFNPGPKCAYIRLAIGAWLARKDSFSSPFVGVGV